MVDAPARLHETPDSGTLPLREESRWWSAAPWVLFAALAAWKLTFLKHLSVGFGTYDEIVYFKYASQLAQGHMYRGAEYPWLYPLSLVPAFLFRNPHTMGVALSAVYSATLVFPLWLIAREMVGPRHATVAAAITCLLPYNYVLGRSLMSEQIYFPMLAFAVYLVTTSRWGRHALWRDVLTGVLAGAMYSTRYLTVPIVFALVIAWWVREWAETGKWLPKGRAFGRLALAAVAGLAMFVPWVVATTAMGTPLKNALGLEIARSKLAEDVHPTAAGFVMYAGLYKAAWVLSLAPLVGGVVLAGVRAFREGARDQLGRVTIATAGLAATLLVVLTRHSWLATYNYPVPERIMVRYGIYVTALGVLIAYAATVAHLRSRPASPAALWVAAFAAPAALVAASWWLQLGSGILPNVSVSVDGGAGDISRIHLMGPWFWVAAFGTLAATAWLLVRRDPRALAALALGSVIFYSVAIPTYVAKLDEFHVYQVLAERVASDEKAAPSDVDVILIALTPDAVKASGLSERGFYKSLEWNVQFFTHRGARSLPLRSMSDPTYVIHSAGSYEGTGTRVSVQGDTYVIERRKPPKRP